MLAAANISAEFPAMGCDHVVLDFSRAQEVSDLGLAAVAATVSTIDCPHVLLRGLGHHQERLLRYLGLDGSILTRGAEENAFAGG